MVGRAVIDFEVFFYAIYASNDTQYHSRSPFLRSVIYFCDSRRVWLSYEWQATALPNVGLTNPASIAFWLDSPSQDADRTNARHVVCFARSYAPHHPFSAIVRGDVPETGCVNSIELNYDAVKGRERIRLHFARNGSEWQKAACGEGEHSGSNALSLGAP